MSSRSVPNLTLIIKTCYKTLLISEISTRILPNDNLDLFEAICNVWLAGQAGGASAAAWTHVPHHVSWCGPSLHVSHFPNQIESSNRCPALLPALVERHTWRVFSPDIMCLSWGGGREYWMNYRGSGFLPVDWFCSSPTPSPVARQ